MSAPTPYRTGRQLKESLQSASTTAFQPAFHGLGIELGETKDVEKEKEKDEILCFQCVTRKSRGGDWPQFTMTQKNETELDCLKTMGTDLRREGYNN
jgi:hypothetical protein